MDSGTSGRVTREVASSRGLGQATALQLTTDGARVVVSGREVETLRTAAGEIGADLPRFPREHAYVTGQALLVDGRMVTVL